MADLSDSSSSSFLTVPAEVREHVYRFILRPDANRVAKRDDCTDYDYRDALVLFKLNKQIYFEARKIFRDLNVFVRIETPWPEAQNHVADEGRTPILVKQERAKRFRDHSLSVLIDAPQTPIQNTEAEKFVILLDDLAKFTRTWHYAELSHPGLNRFLRLTLDLRDPYTPDWEETRVSRALQRRLLLPFGEVKELREVNIRGDPTPFPSIEAELKELQAVPYESAEHCLRECTRLKAQGNEELGKGNLKLALQRYQEAWEAIHIIVRGRRRDTHADAFFERYLREEPFKGKNGQTERLMLRVQLVANTVLAYIKLKDWAEAEFWGMRSINMLRRAIPADDGGDLPPEREAVPEFPAKEPMGKIYYRTALAYKELGDMSQARKLLRVSAVYLPGDESVRREIAACAIRLG